MLPTRTLRHAQHLLSTFPSHARCLVLDSQMHMSMLRRSLAGPVQYRVNTDVHADQPYHTLDASS